MVCNRCRNIIRDNEIKCPYCGAQINKVAHAENGLSPHPPQQPEKKQDNSTKIVIIVMSSVLGLIFIVMLMVFIFSFGGGTSPDVDYDEFNNGNVFDEYGELHSVDGSDNPFVQNTTQQTEQNQQTTVPQTTAPQQTTAPATKSAPSYITEREIISLYTQANKLFEGWISHGWEANKQDYDDCITVGNMRYNRLVSDKFNTVDEIRNACSEYFAPTIYEETIDNCYKMQNGKLYANEAMGQGGAEFYDSLTLYVEDITADYCRFSVSCYEGNSLSYKYDNELKKVDGKWIFINDFYPNYTLYFNENIKWSY